MSNIGCSILDYRKFGILEVSRTMQKESIEQTIRLLESIHSRSEYDLLIQPIKFKPGSRPTSISWDDLFMKRMFGKLLEHKTVRPIWGGPSWVVFYLVMLYSKNLSISVGKALGAYNGWFSCFPMILDISACNYLIGGVCSFEQTIPRNSSLNSLMNWNIDSNASYNLLSVFRWCPTESEDLLGSSILFIIDCRFETV